MFSAETMRKGNPPAYQASAGSGAPTGPAAPPAGDVSLPPGVTALPSRRVPADALGERPSAGISARTPSPTGQLVGSDGIEDAEDGESLTAAGLVRRSPKQQLRAMARGEAEAAANRVAASQRSPEEVRKMLSRYRSGLQRGRTIPATMPDTADDGPGAGHGAIDPDQPELASAHEHAAEELPWRP